MRAVHLLTGPCCARPDLGGARGSATARCRKPLTLTPDLMLTGAWRARPDLGGARAAQHAAEQPGP